MRVPKLCKNGDGRAFAIIPKSGKQRKYFGVYGSKEASRKYAEWVKRISTEESPRPAGTENIEVCDLVRLYLHYAHSYYESTLENANGEYYQMRDALTPVVENYGSEGVEIIGPRFIVGTQKQMVKDGLSRSTINRRISRVKRFVRWCASEELIPPEKYEAVRCVRGLRKNQYGVKDTPKVKAIPWNDAKQVLPFVSPQVATMIQVQYMCGMRPQDVCNIRPKDIDQSGPIWLYRPEKHKTDYLDAELIKAIPPVAQGLLMPYLERDPEAYLFSPRESQQWRYDNANPSAKAERTTPVYPCEIKRREAEKKKRRANRNYGRFAEKYNTGSYNRAVKHGFAKAESQKIEIPRWSPNQLRHAIATDISAKLGEQAAQMYLGHAKLETTGIYAEKRVQDLIAVASQIESVVAQERPRLSFQGGKPQG